MQVEDVLLVELVLRPQHELRPLLVEAVRDELLFHPVGRLAYLRERPLVVEVGVDVRQQDDDLETLLLEVDELVRRQHVTDVEDAGGLVPDVRPLPLWVLTQRAYLLGGDHLGRVPGDPFVGVHTRGETTVRDMTSGSTLSLPTVGPHHPVAQPTA